MKQKKRHEAKSGKAEKHFSEGSAPPNDLKKAKSDAERIVLELVVKVESMGIQDAVLQILRGKTEDGVELRVIHIGVGDVSKSDVLMAQTGSKLILGFNVGPAQGIEALCKEKGIEVRLYDVVYTLSQDVDRVARSLKPPRVEERIIGKAKVIALFKGGEKGTILGCEVLDGSLRTGKRFRIFSAMGPIYDGRIESLHIEEDTVAEAGTGRQVGLKISHFKGARLGDLVESYEIPKTKAPPPWRPKGGVFWYQGGK